MTQSTLVAAESKSNSTELQLENESFARVVLEFLGKKEQLNYDSEVGYTLHHSDIESFHFLLQEKTNKEQPTNINHFQVDIGYDDGTTRKLSGIENLSHFSETRDVSPVSVVMSWNILVKYPNADTVENQKVSVTFTRDKDYDHNHKVSISIEHTNQVWAIEVLNMFKNQIAFISHKSDWKCRASLTATRYMRSQRGILFITFLVLYATLIAAFFPIFNTKFAANAANRNVLLSSLATDIDQSDAQIALLSMSSLDSKGMIKASELISNEVLSAALITVANTRTRHLTIGLSFICFVSFVPYLTYIFLSEYSRRYGQSTHIPITKKAEKQMIDSISRRSRARFISITAIIGSVFCGVIGNLVFHIIS